MPISLGEQRANLTVAMQKIANLKASDMRQSERERVLESLRATIKTLALMEVHEGAFREYLKAQTKPPGEPAT